MSKSFYITTLTLFFVGIFLWFFYPPPKLPIKVGLMVSLTGSSPDLGREIRDGAFMAVEEINNGGGINGRRIELIIKDNMANSEIAKENYLEFLNEGVTAVIGPATSTIARALLPLINEHKLLAISPTVSATEFIGKDDYFITLEPCNNKFARVFGKYVREKIKPKKILIMIDERNPVYTGDFAGSFTNQIEKISSIYTLTISEKVSDFDELVNHALSYRPDFVLIITDIFNASIIIQKIRRINSHVQLGIAPWARFYGLVVFTGHFSEGVLSVDFYDQSTKKYMEFKEKFMKKFGYPPDSSVINGYNAVMIIKEAVLKSVNSGSIKENILNSKFNLPLGDISINQYGDSEIEPFVIVIKNGIFERIES